MTLSFKIWYEDDHLVFDNPKFLPPKDFLVTLRILKQSQDFNPTLYRDPIEIQESICIPCTDLVSPHCRCDATNASTFMYRILSEHGILAAVCDQIAHQFSHFARWMFRDPRFALCFVLPIMVDLKLVSVFRVRPDGRDQTLALPLNLVAASKSAIEALEKLKLADGAEEQCLICLEKIPVGSTVTRLPCSHLYHGNCIKQWLQSNHLCPLCRFPIPC